MWTKHLTLQASLVVAAAIGLASAINPSLSIFTVLLLSVCFGMLIQIRKSEKESTLSWFGYGAIVCLALLPGRLFSPLETIGQVYVPFRTWIVLACYCVCLMLRRGNGFNALETKLWTFVVLYAGISTVFSRTDNPVRPYISFVFLVLPPMFSAISARFSDKQRRHAVIFLIAVGIVISLQVLVTWAFPDQAIAYTGWTRSVETISRGRTTVGSINTTACLIAICMPTSSALALDESHGKSRRLYIACVLLFLICLLISQEKGPLFAAIAATMIVLVRKRFSSLRLLRLSVIVVLIGLVLVFIVIPRLSLDRLGDFSYESLAGRFDTLITALQLFSEQPLFGWGVGTYQRWWEDPTTNIMEIGGYLTLIEPHNAYALCLVEMGILGALPFFMLIVLLMKGRGHMDIYSDAAWAGVISFLIVEMTASNLAHSPQVSSVFWLFLGIASAKG